MRVTFTTNCDDGIEMCSISAQIETECGTFSYHVLLHEDDIRKELGAALRGEPAPRLAKLGAEIIGFAQLGRVCSPKHP